MCTQLVILDIGKTNPFLFMDGTECVFSHRLELQNRLPWLAIKEKPISDTASAATDATQNNTTVA